MYRELSTLSSFRSVTLSTALKSTALMIAGILVLPFVAGYRIASLAPTSERVFPGFSQLVSLWPGLTGGYLRLAFYRMVLPACGADCWISF